MNFYDMKISSSKTPGEREEEEDIMKDQVLIRHSKRRNMQMSGKYPNSTNPFEIALIRDHNLWFMLVLECITLCNKTKKSCLSEFFSAKSYSHLVGWAEKIAFPPLN